MRSGIEIKERYLYPEKTILSIGIPSVRDLWVEQNMIATVSAGVNEESLMVAKENVNINRQHCRQIISTATANMLEESISPLLCENVSQNVV